MSHLYAIQTAEYGQLLLEADDIAHARKLARDRFRVTHKSDVYRWRSLHVLCDRCDSRPCCCEENSP